MKSYRLFFYVSLILSAFFLISCEDEPLDVGLDDGLPDFGMGNITFKIDGEFKEYVGVGSYRDHDFGEFDGENMDAHGWQIVGTNPDQSGESLGIQLFPADLGTGRYDLTDENFEEIFVIQYSEAIDFESGDFDYYTSISGYVDITEVDLEAETMSGTFKATLEFFTIEDEEIITIELTDGLLSDIQLIVVDDSIFE